MLKLIAMTSLIRPFIRDLVADIFFISGLTGPSSRHKRHPFIIITFHRILTLEQIKNYPIPELAVTPDELFWFLKLVKQYYTCATITQNYKRWITSEYTNKPLLSITFDDGQLDNFIHAEPLLSQTEIPGTFYVVTNSVESNEILWFDRLAYAVFELSRFNKQKLKQCFEKLNLNFDVSTNHYEISLKIVEFAKTLSDSNRMDCINVFEASVGKQSRPDWDGMMNWEQLKVLINKGHEIGSHSRSHPILPLCSESQLADEIIKSKQIIEDKLNYPVKSFCYPNGNTNTSINSLVKKAGYTVGVTTEWGINASIDVSPHALTRCDIQWKTSCSRYNKLSKSHFFWRLSPFFKLR